MKLIKPVITRSNEIYAKAKEIIPAGTQTFSKGVTQFVNGFAPKYMERAKGCITWDVDGNKYIDYIMGNQPVVLGYADADVNRAVINQLEKGSTFSQMSELEVIVSELLIKYIPCAEAVRFGKNGSDATTAAVRVARAVTGRNHIAFSGYHGWHDWFIASTDLNSGIPDFNKELSHKFQFNDIGSLERIFNEYGDDLACVIMEPLTVLEPSDNFLQKVRELCTINNTLLIFDEVITGFRFAIGGAQELTGVTPDLATFAKGISNGIPLSAIVGKKEYMFALEKTFFSFTYGGECLGLAAAEASINKIASEDVPGYLNTIGLKLKVGLNDIITAYGMNDYLECIGYPCRTIMAINGGSNYDTLEIKSYIQQELIRRGILWTAYHSLSFSHDYSHIETTLEAFDDSVNELSSIIKTGQNLRSRIEGDPVKAVFRQVSDFNSFIQQKGEV
jgi:glutamate-1-semialdehyde 2,1-aminomutase